MPLTRPDPNSVLAEGETLLVIGLDDFPEFLRSKSQAIVRQAREQNIDGDPARSVEFDADRFWVVAQDVAEPLADGSRSIEVQPVPAYLKLVTRFALNTPWG